MNCPSDETLDEFIDFGSSSISDSLLREHVKECALCSEKLRTAELTFELVEASMATEVPAEVFLLTRSRLDMHEARKRTLQFGFAAVAMMIACVSSMSLLPLSAPPTTHSAADESPSTHGETPHSETLASVTANSDSIVVPVESTSENVSVFLIYPTVKADVPDDSTFRNQPITSIARS